MSAIKRPTGAAIDYVYDARRRSWIACYPNRRFVERIVRECRGRLNRPSSETRGPSQIEVDASVAIVLLMQIASIVYLIVTMHLY